MTPWRQRLESALARPVSSQSLAVYRILFGSLLFLSTIRFMASGWLDVFYVRAKFHFTYWGFDWVRVLPEAGMWALYGGIAASALLIALGLFTRLSTFAFLVLFAYAEFTDVTNYLNHYYLVILMAFLLLLLPTGARWSLDALRRPGRRRLEIPAWMLYLLRFQVAVVYVHAGLAKLGSDWLLHAQPMRIWLAARDETPLFGSLFAEPATAYLFSWAGFLFDSTIVAWLLWKRTRPAAFFLVLAFHGLTQVLFDIGIFPLLMLINSTLFFDPDWPGRLWARIRRRAAPVAPAPAPALPLFSRRGAKSGSITFHARDPVTGRAWQVSPSKYLTARQELEMSGQPDLIQQLARRIADDLRKQGRGEIEIHAEARVSLNGRPARLLIDPSVDLARVPVGIAPAPWILPGPSDPPLAARSGR
jgi:vitamin K-dependent gamma-carboxylase